MVQVASSARPAPTPQAGMAHTSGFDQQMIGLGLNTRDMGAGVGVGMAPPVPGGGWPAGSWRCGAQYAREVVSYRREVGSSLMPHKLVSRLPPRYRLTFYSSRSSFYSLTKARSLSEQDNNGTISYLKRQIMNQLHISPRLSRHHHHTVLYSPAKRRCDPRSIRLLQHERRAATTLRLPKTPIKLFREQPIPT